MTTLLARLLINCPILGLEKPGLIVSVAIWTTDEFPSHAHFPGGGAIIVKTSTALGEL
jgi:hypothetical protein